MNFLYQKVLHPGTSFNIKNKGVPHIRGNGRGDLRFTVDIDVPKKLTDKQREILKAFAEASSEEVNPKKKGFWEKK